MSISEGHRFSEIMSEERFKELKPFMPPRMVRRQVPSEAEMRHRRITIDFEREEYMQEVSGRLFKSAITGVVSADETIEIYRTELSEFDRLHPTPEAITLIEVIPYEYI